MYKYDDGQLYIFDYTLEDIYKLDPNNRWVKRAKTVPWDKAEEKYAHMFRKNGRPAKQIRMALGALLIKEYLKCSDEETVESISEQPYLQYFIGLKKFTNEAPFDPSLMTWFRKRLTPKFMMEINDAMSVSEATPEEESPRKNDDDEPHGGTLIIDATCAPANIKYPTDTSLMAEAIEKTDAMIDELQKPLEGKKPRPRTYRVKSRKLFAGFTKRRKPGGKLIRKIKRKQLGYLKRNIGFIHKMMDEGGVLPAKRMKTLSTIEKLYAQQEEMYQNKTNSVQERIVSISQPHIRPIVRGKVGTPVEFGAKINMSVVNGYVFLNDVNYNAYHEGELLENAIIDYYCRFKMLPSKILVDRAYTSRKNRGLCKELGIKLAGKPLGRRPKNGYDYNEKEDTSSRVEIEGKFGTLKTRYSWNRIMARLPETGMTVISVAAFAFNLAKRAKALLRLFCFSDFFRFFASFEVA